jgi:DNA-binding transcriptional regulator YdaS (Cro superfamily)
MTSSTSPLLGHPAQTTDARIGRMVEVLVDLLGVQKQELAEWVGMKPASLGQKISGSRPWKADELNRIAAALGFPVSVRYSDPEEVVGALRERRPINYRKSA